MDNALDLPEVRTIIGSLLTQKEVANCSSVCREWNASFVPLLWRNVNIMHLRHLTQAAGAKQAPIRHTESDILQHGHRVRTLTYYGHVSPQFYALVKACTSLQALKVSVYPRELPEIVQEQILSRPPPGVPAKPCYRPWDSCSSLVQANHRTLTSLTLQGTRQPVHIFPRSFLEPVAQCTQLANLRFEGWLITPVALANLLEQLINLVAFESKNCQWDTPANVNNNDINNTGTSSSAILYDCGSNDHEHNDDVSNSFNPHEYPTPALAFPNALTQLKSLLMADGRRSTVHLGYYLRLAQQCPNLEELTWGLVNGQHQYDNSAQINRRFQEISELLRSPTQWPLLKKFHIGDHCHLMQNEKLQDQQVAHILNSRAGLNPLRSLGFAFTTVGPLAFAALAPYFADLTELDLVETEGFTSFNFQQILESCPNLRVLKGTHIQIVDIYQGKPWACLRLKELSLYFGTTVHRHLDMIIPDRIVFEQLRRLTRLRTLTLSRGTAAARQEAALAHRMTSRPTGRQSSSTNTRLLFRSRTLQWRLGNGLELLEGLKDLTTICFPGHLGAGIRDSDLEWMLKHWPSLQGIRGRMGTEDWETKHLANIVSDRGYMSDFFMHMSVKRTRSIAAIPSRLNWHRSPKRGSGRGRGFGRGRENMWISALDIPHIIESIVEPLSKRDYAACCLVSHHWRDVFQPVLWQHLDFKRDINGDLHWREDAVNAEKAQQSQDLLAMVGKNGRSIQSLRLSTDVAVNAILLLSRTSYHLDQRQQLRDNITLGNLNRLHFGDKLPPGSCLESSLFLFQQSNSLKELQMDVLKVLTFAELVLFPTYLAALSQTKSLTSIHIMRTEIRHNLVEDLLMNLPTSLMELDLNLEGVHVHEWIWTINHIRTVTSAPPWRRKQRNERKKGRNIPLQYAELSNKRSSWIEYKTLSKVRINSNNCEAIGKYLPSFLAKCPGLTSLTLEEPPSRCLEDMCAVLNRCCPKLELFKMPSYYGDPNLILPLFAPPSSSSSSSSSDLESIVSQPRLTSKSSSYSPSGRLSTLEFNVCYDHKINFLPSMIEHCGHSLGHLVFDRAPSLASHQIQYLFCSLPQLESFSLKTAKLPLTPENPYRPSFRWIPWCPNLRANDIVQGMNDVSKSSWACLKLKSLRLTIMDDSPFLNEDPKIVFATVSKQMEILTQLQTCHVVWWSHDTVLKAAWPYDQGNG
ncbi:hypothetical protein BG004_005640 [Podila humilis]|nr:hypothetical protein BG004_005640 [Podila humilis]